MRRILAAVVGGGLLIAGCSDDGGSDGGSADPALVQLLRDEAGQTEPVATCIAEELDGVDAVDRDELEAVIRGEGTTDLATSNAYGDAALACAEDVVGG